MGKQKIAVIDYGSGNIRSAAKSFEHVIAKEGMDADVVVTVRAEDIRTADRIVLPGQGAFGDCIGSLRKLPGMVEALEEKVLRGGAPFFGICVGMQLLATRGMEFGEHEGLGWIPGTVRRMTPSDPTLKIPHMGWNNVFVNPDCPHSMLRGVIETLKNDAPDFYFVHSFVFDCEDDKHVAGWCDYGGRFAAIVAHNNIVGAQCHPEKSQDAGLELVRAFLDWTP